MIGQEHRQLHHRREARRRRHGGRLSGDRQPSPSRRRAQVHPRSAGQGPADHGSLRARGPGAGLAQPSQYRVDLRPGRERGPARAGDGARFGRRAGDPNRCAARSRSRRRCASRSRSQRRSRRRTTKASSIATSSPPTSSSATSDSEGSAGSQVKILDFGLAKALQGDLASSSGIDLTRSPTLSVAATQAGMILGTAGLHEPGAGAGVVGRSPRRHLVVRRDPVTS